MFDSIFMKKLTLILFIFPVIGDAQVCKPESITNTTGHLVSNNDGTVTDGKTGLVWKKCSEGQVWNITTDTCDRMPMNYSWRLALDQAKNINTNIGFAGRIDWRIPNIKELASIVEDSCYFPAINLNVFPNTPSDAFWTSSFVAQHSYQDPNFRVWHINFEDGIDGNSGKDSGMYVRLVRGGQ